MAHPGKLTPERQKTLVDAIRHGHYYETACAYAGISYQTFRNWVQLSEHAKNGRYFEFFEAITRAEAEAENRAVQLWQAAMEKDWRAAQMFLERRRPDRWGKQDKIGLMHEGKVAVEHGVDVSGANALLEALGFGPVGTTLPTATEDPDPSVS